jgi:hypothetical protein
MKKKNAPRHAWTLAEEASFAARYPIMRTEELAAEMGLKPTQLHDKASALGIKKDPEWMKAHLQECARRAYHSGKWRGFAPGHKTWNKGISFTSGGASVQTRFQPKNLPHNYRPLGSERVMSGFLQRKLTETGYPPRDWVYVHHIVWQEAGMGKVPKDMALIFRDGNRMNFAIENLELISRAELMRRNSVHNYGPDLAKLIHLRGQIIRQINRRERKENP